MDIIHVFVRFCMLLNPTMCRELEIVPVEQVMIDGKSVVMPMTASNMMQCMRGVMSRPQVEFDMDGARWTVKGGRCEQIPANITEVQALLRASVR